MVSRSWRFRPLLLLGCLGALLMGITPFDQYARADITGSTLGTPTHYDSAAGDTWYNTWGNDSEVYATSDDASSFSGGCNNNWTFNELSGDDPSQLTSPYHNCMTGYASASNTEGYADGATWKTDGVLSVAGTIYVAVARQVDGFGGYPNGYQVSTNASIIKSTDHGRTWSNGFGVANDPNGAPPAYNTTTKTVQATFPGSSFATPEFINYGQDDTVASTANGGDTYVYAISNDGFAYDGSSMLLGRVRRDHIANLNGADWQYYTGGDGTNAANWSSNPASASHIISAAHHLSQSGVHYIPALHRYVLTSFYYPFNSSWPNNGQASHTTWNFYQSPTPWGPWTQFTTIDTTPYGRYDPVLVSKFMRVDGLSQTIFTSDDYTTSSTNGDTNYRLHVFPFTLTSNDAFAATDDSSSAITYAGSGWQSVTVPDYFNNGTLHFTATSGASASYTFNGTFVQWIGATNTNHGIASVSIDSGAPVAVDTYSPTWNKQVILFDQTGLANGQHTLTITATGSKNSASSGTYQDVDAIVTGATPPPIYGVNSGAGNYRGAWTTGTIAGYYSNPVHLTNTAGSSVSYTFSGTRIAWLGARNTDHGIASVAIDGGAAIAVDTYGPVWGKQAILFSRGGLTPGQHTLTITAMGSKNSASSDIYQDVDAFGV